MTALAKRNPWFAHWVQYSHAKSRHAEATFDEYVQRNLTNVSMEDREFILLMGRLGALLTHFHDNNQELPEYYFQRIWFLHNIRKPERNLQARALVQGLVEAMHSCTSA